ncbi:DUF4276 family protein [Methylobacterium sp. Leaf100]|uniref:DUF4276 family protein n=1 Tax=Methylobacterium sp. Leaf100 TaxID=1736252 RepID=UPI0006F431A1|nr:DUF4276 family protein [Methylobacterium sp. Leaf100]KQP36596.1 hypothetical protein ASF25_01125 [Methylobacterium sp. Leaf100]
MKRHYVFCEGPTEESFVDNLLLEHFAPRDVIAKPLVLPSKAGSTSRQHKGGWTSYSKARRFIRLTMEQMHADDTWFTTMLDLYALPSDFPNAATDADRSGEARVVALEAAFRTDIRTDQLWRFTPYLQCHEYEALLLADPEALLRFYPDRQDAIAALRQDIGDLAPEAVNEGPETAPSKRILRHLPEYTKVLAGTLVAMEIGLPTLRARCPHFDAWMTELESRLG